MSYINILTIHKEPNYGACLQAYALYTAVKQLGGNPRIIDLSMDYRSHAYTLLNRGVMPVYQYIKGYHYCYKKASDFSEKYCPCRTDTFYTIEQLKAYSWNPDDSYLIGSDQVWNPDITMNLANAYNFSFLPNSITNRFSYAASMGYLKDENSYRARFDIDALKKLKRVGVREKFAVDFLSKDGIKATEVIDPTLLFDDYSDITGAGVKEKNDYLFYFSLGENEEMNKFANRIAQKNGLQIEKRYGYLQPKRGTNMSFLSVEEWLWKIKNASIVVTDSFHATVFSILFGRSFYVYLTSPIKASRIDNLLKALGITDRIFYNTAETSVSKIDYEWVHHILKDYRKESLEFLLSIIKNCN